MLNGYVLVSFTVNLCLVFHASKHLIEKKQKIEFKKNVLKCYLLY